MEDVFDVLAEDHEEIRQALAELEKGPTAATGATEDQLMLRRIMTEELIIEEAKHEQVELACLWQAVREHVPGGDRLADRVICAEIEIVTLLAELAKLDVTAPEFEQLLSAFTRAGREHFDFEERHAWPLLHSAIRSGALTARAAGELGRRVVLARMSAPVLPFPRASAPLQWPGESAHHSSFG
jgi:hypothetical protein